MKDLIESTKDIMELQGIEDHIENINEENLEEGLLLGAVGLLLGIPLVGVFVGAFIYNLIDPDASIFDDGVGDGGPITKTVKALIKTGKDMAGAVIDILKSIKNGVIDDLDFVLLKVGLAKLQKSEKVKSLVREFAGTTGKGSRDKRQQLKREIMKEMTDAFGGDESYGKLAKHLNPFVKKAIKNLHNSYKK